MQKAQTLMITGGHVTPALAIIDRLQEQIPPLSIVFVGRKYNNNREQTLSFEYKEIRKRSIPFIHLATGRLTRMLTAESMRDSMRIPGGFAQSFSIIRTHKPTAILAFGGYLAVPIAIIGAAFGVPVYTHEQTIELGLSNRIIGRVARNIFTSFPETTHPSLQPKIIHTGNPLRQNILSKQAPSITYAKPLIYVTGGSLGSHAINEYIEHNLSQLLPHYHIIHQTGNVAEFGDFKRLMALRTTLPKKWQRRYEIYEHITTSKVGAIMRSAELVISRSGANTFFELIALSKKSVLIPLPWSAAHEQQKHAKILQDAGVAAIVAQGDNDEHFLDVINTIMKKNKSYEKNFQNLKKRYITQAADAIIGTIFAEK